MMRKKIKKIIMCVAMTMISIAPAMGQEATQKKEFDWSGVMDAIIQVESKGNPKAHNPRGDCAGILQITKVCVKEANNILKEKGIKKTFSLSDRWDQEKSKEIFRLIQNKYNPEHDFVKACRIWNEGPYYNRKIKTTKYVEKVLKELK